MTVYPVSYNPETGSVSTGGCGYTLHSVPKLEDIPIYAVSVNEDEVHLMPFIAPGFSTPVGWVNRQEYQNWSQCMAAVSKTDDPSLADTILDKGMSWMETGALMVGSGIVVSLAINSLALLAVPLLYWGGIALVAFGAVAILGGLVGKGIDELGEVLTESPIQDIVARLGEKVEEANKESEVATVAH